MNWKLIFFLSFFGLAMAIGSVYWIPVTSEWMVWLPIFIICAYLIARNTRNNAFLHGFFVSLFNCFWILSVHLILYRAFKANQPDLGSINSQMPIQGHPRIMMVIIGLVIGVVSGLVLGLFSYVASRLVTKKKAE